jgi:hypothetical protein
VVLAQQTKAQHRMPPARRPSLQIKGRLPFHGQGLWIQGFECLSCAQELNPDLLLGTTMNPCAQVVASKLSRPMVSYFPAGPLEPFMTSLWRGSNRRAFIPNPISYFPQMGLRTESQHLVGPLL